jgi:small-conductance mechanosensitive channel
LAAVEPSSGTQNEVEQINADVDRLDPELDALLDRANQSLAQSASFLELADLQRQLAYTAAPLDAGERVLEVEAQRVGKALDDIAQAQQVWSATRSRPETLAAEALVGGSVQRSIDELDQAASDLNAWRVRVLALSDRLTDRIAAVNAMNDRLQAAQTADRTNLFVPRAPLWQSGFGAELRNELPGVPEQLRSFSGRMAAYVRNNPRPLVLQALAAALLMFGFGRLSARARERLGRDAEDSRLLDRPYAAALLLALLGASFFHPLAPSGFLQAFAIVALVPAARIVLRATDRASLSLFIGLFVLTILDRITLALAPLPAIAHTTLILLLAAAFGLAFWFKRRLQLENDNPWLRHAVNLVMLLLALAFMAGLGGWSDLATLLGRGTLASIYAGLFICALVVALQPFVLYLLTSPTLRRSHMFERNTGLLRRHVERALRWIGGMLWLYFVLRATGLINWAETALQALLNLGISVGAFSLTTGGVLAFVLTLVVARQIARVIDEILREDFYPRRSLQRGMADALSALVRYGIYTIGFLAALAAAGIQFSQLSILLGGFGIGLGLGLQDLVKNFAAGLTLLGERRLNVGDALQIPGQDIFGRVRAIGMRATVVRNWNGSEVIVPNADLVSGAVTNWTLSDPLRRIEIPIGVAYGTDPAQVIALLLDVARSNDRVLKDPPPQTLFKGFGDSSLDFVLRAWTDQDHEVVASDLTLALNHRFVDAGIEIPFPQRDLHLASVSPEVRAALSGRDEPKK